MSRATQLQVSSSVELSIRSLTASAISADNRLIVPKGLKIEKKTKTSASVKTTFNHKEVQLTTYLKHPLHHPIEDILH